MRDIEIPDGIGAVGYTESDIPDLVDGTMKQQRLLATAPKPVTEDDIAGIYRRSLSLWWTPRRPSRCPGLQGHVRRVPRPRHLPAHPPPHGTGTPALP